MALGDRDMERAAIRALDLEGNECVLEIGVGPGVGVRRLRRRLPWGYVCGVDASQVMLRQAVLRNRRAFRRGLVDLKPGDASHIPWPDGRFDVVVSINNVMLWDPLGEGMAEARRVLKPDGHIWIAVHAWDGDALRDDVVAAAWDAGFPVVRTKVLRTTSGHALLFTARAA